MKGLMLTAAVTTSGGACLMQFPEELRIYPDDACLHSLNQILASKQKDSVQVQYH
jgi:DNA polymerase-3 subunit alpha